MTEPLDDPMDFTKWQKRTSDPDLVVVPDEDEGSKIEVAPKIQPPKITERFSELTEKIRKSSPISNRAAKPVKSRSSKPRMPLSNLLSGAWQMLAQVTQPINPPMARVLDMQAPVAGEILEGIIANTVVDRVLQPLARVEQGGETAFALVGPPLLIGVLTQKPEMAPVIIPALKASLRSWIKIAGPEIEKKQQEEQEFEEKYGYKIDEMISYIIGDYFGPVGPEVSYVEPEPKMTPKKRAPRKANATVAG